MIDDPHELLCVAEELRRKNKVRIKCLGSLTPQQQYQLMQKVDKLVKGMDFGAKVS